MEQRESKHEAGDIVYAKKINPNIKLVVGRYVDKIYYCQFPGEPDRKKLALFERKSINKETSASCWSDLSI